MKYLYWKILRNLDVNKASGPDSIPLRVLKHCTPELSPVLRRLFRLSLETDIVRKSWKFANVQPVPKKGKRTDLSNYRPNALSSTFCKVMDRIINKQLLTYLERIDILRDN